MSIEDKIRMYALQNAVKFGGKANPGVIIGRLMQDDVSVKDRLSEISPLIQKIVTFVNSMDANSQLAELKEKYPQALEEKKAEKKEGLKELPNVKGNVVMRFAPSPSGPLHIGHSYVLSLNYEYVKKYGGQLYLRIEDTNPENIDPIAYTQIPDDANWLCENGVNKVIIQSDRIEHYYKRAKELIEKNAAYICTCNPDVFKELLSSGKPCPCRNLPVNDNLERYNAMFSTYRQGDAVMRFKSDIAHKNPAMRDFPLMRINESPHPRQGQKYRVWPLMNLAVAVDDMEFNVTHALRAKDHADNAIRQSMLHNVWGFDTPEAISVGRINFEGFDLSTTQTKLKIKEGIYSGWDDIRIPFLLALKRRGFRPYALRKFAVSVGITKTDKTVHIDEFFKTINAFNTEIIEKESDRYFFVKDPVKIKVEGAPKQFLELPLHPEFKERGMRKFTTENEFFITRQDYDRIPQNKIFRLMDCMNVIRKGDEFFFDSLEYEKYKNSGASMIIHWLPSDNVQIVEASVALPSGEKNLGFAEGNVRQLSEGTGIQFERFGFVRFDHRWGDKFIFWLTHN